MVLKSLKEHRGKIILLLLTLFPVIPWIFMEPLGARFMSPTVALTSLSQVSALLGTVLFTLTTLLIVSSRFSVRLFNDPQSLLQARRVTWVVATLLLLAHPIVLAIKLVPYSTINAVDFFLPGSDWVFNFGIYALVLMLALHGLQFLARKNGQLRHTPLVMGSVLFLGTLHAFFIPSDLSQNIVLKTYVLGIVGVTLGESMYQFLLTKGRSRQINTLVEPEVALK